MPYIICKIYLSLHMRLHWFSYSKKRGEIAVSNRTKHGKSWLQIFLALALKTIMTSEKKLEVKGNETDHTSDFSLHIKKKKKKPFNHIWIDWK